MASAMTQSPGNNHNNMQSATQPQAVSLTVLALRVPEPCDLHAQLSQWLEGGLTDDDDDHHEERAARPNFLASDCRDDLERLASLRRTVGEQLSYGHAQAAKHLKALCEYAALLQQCCQRGFPVTDLEGEGLTLAWKSMEELDEEDGHDMMDAQYSCSRGLTPHTETHHSLAWERANVLYNIAVLYAYQAPVHQPTRQSQSHAATCLQQAATIVAYLRDTVLPLTGPLTSLALSVSFLNVYESLLLAEAQRAAYQTFGHQARPKHFLLAKLAAAAAPLYQNVEDECQNDSRFSTTELVLDWEDAVRAWGMWMTALTEYHSSIQHREKKEYGLELARLEGALKFGSFCKDFCESTSILEDLALEVMPVLQEMDDRYEAAEQDNRQHQFAIPEHDELPEIAPQQTVKTDPTQLSKLLPTAPPLFAGVLDPAVRAQVDTVRSELQSLAREQQMRCEDASQQARSALAEVQLPHSLTAYAQQSHGGGGLPDDVWRRVEQHVSPSQMSNTLGHMREDADRARSTLSQLQDQLDDNSERDGAFRQQNSQFEGHVVQEIQQPFRQALQNYHRLLMAAQESDEVLQERCDRLADDPKFSLLEFPKNHLDRLLPASGSRSPPDVDSSRLSNYLVDLSSLLNERDSMVHALQEQIKSHGVAQELANVVPPNEDEYHRIVEAAKHSLDDIFADIDHNLNTQEGMLDRIMEENDTFTRLRDQSSLSNADSALANIEDALDELEQISRHMQEGQTFYDVIVPKLEKLHDQVQDVSNRLANERSDYQEHTRRMRQNSGMGNSNGSGRNLDHGRARYQNNYDGRSQSRHLSSQPYQNHPNQHQQHNPQQQPSSHNPRPQPSSSYGRAAQVQSTGNVTVDDEKFANLIAMDFDPEKVVDALKKHNNDFEQALNDLLSC